MPDTNAGRATGKVAFPAEAEAAFQRYLEATENYMAVVREAGDLPWFDDPDRRGKVAAHLGLPADTPALELRRALWDRGHVR